MRAFLQPKPALSSGGPSHANKVAEETRGSRAGPDELVVTEDIFTGYISDLEDDSDDENLALFPAEGVPTCKENEMEPAGTESEPRSENEEWEDVSEGPFRVHNPPALKHRCHDIPVRIARKKRKKEMQGELEKALKMIEKVIATKKKVFFF